MGFARVVAVIGSSEDETEMSLSGYIVMTVILVGIWGGFAYLLYQTLKRERRS
jgi:hypothetical protein